VSWVPTMASTPSSAKHELHPAFRQVVAFSTTLPAVLGYDRSGLGEAVVLEHGMPVTRPDEALEGRQKGDLIIKFPIKLPTKQRRLHVVRFQPWICQLLSSP
jgi:hypothetical protein